MKPFYKLDKKEDLFDVENYDDETRHVLTAPPNWVIRNGMAAIFFVVVVILLVSYFIKYPDIITSEITITSYNTPAEIKARASGRITLFVKEKELVKEGTTLGFISNASNYGDIKELDQFLSKIATESDVLGLERQKIPNQLNLGEVERSFIDFLTALDEYHIFKNINGNDKTIGELNNQIKIYKLLEKQLDNQKKLVLQELQIAGRKLKVDSLLLTQKVISQLDYEKSMTDYLPYKKQAEQINQSILNNSLRIAELGSRISELSISNHQSENRLQGALLSSFNNLHSDLKMWEDRYLLKSPIEGQVAFFKFWNDNQNVDQNETILTIVPEKNNTFGYILMPIQGSGKAKIGQAVNIKLHSYPYHEFGIVKGEIMKISSVPQNDMYAVTVKLGNGLTTTHNISLEFREQMKGTAEIVTTDLRLIERFFYQVNKIISRN